MLFSSMTKTLSTLHAVLGYKNIKEVFEWQAQFPDLNPIEHQWDHLDKKKTRNLKFSSHAN